jgi:biopolymer transport protein ExbD
MVKMKNEGYKDEEFMGEINITPLTDVFLVLLIIFMIATPFLMQEGIRVHLPSSYMGKPEPKTLIVTVDRESRIYIDGEEIEPSELLKEIEERLRDREEKVVILRGDRLIPLGDAVKVMDIAKRAGALRLAIAVEKKDE